MEPKAKLKPLTLIMLLLITIFIQYSCSAHSRKLASSPTPAPSSEEPLFIRRNEKKKRGSMPANCHGMCNQCVPCLPVQVSVRTMDYEEIQYYPQVWKCMCHNNTFSP